MKWNNWGRKTVRRMKSTMSMMGVTQSTDQLMYTDGRWAYQVDQVANTATKMESPMLNMANRKDPNLMKVGTDFIKAMGGKIVVKEIDPFKHIQELQGLGRGSGIAGKKKGTQEIMPQGQDRRKMLEQLKKMQEHMQQQ